MIYFQNILDTQRLCIPASPARQGAVFTLRLRNTVDGQEYVFSTATVSRLRDANGAYVVDATGRYILLAGGGGDASLVVDAVAGGYYVASILLPSGMADGEYEYAADMDGDPVACGIARVGDFGAESVNYRNPVIYEQYKN